MSHQPVAGLPQSPVRKGGRAKEGRRKRGRNEGGREGGRLKRVTCVLCVFSGYRYIL